MSIEITILISVVSICCTIFATARNRKKDTRDRATQDTTVLIKLENIQTGINDIKKDVLGVKEDMKALEHRMTVVEQSAKQAHKRLDDVRNELKGD